MVHSRETYKQRYQARQEIIDIPQAYRNSRFACKLIKERIDVMSIEFSVYAFWKLIQLGNGIWEILCKRFLDIFTAFNNPSWYFPFVWEIFLTTGDIKLGNTPYAFQLVLVEVHSLSHFVFERVFLIAKDLSFSLEAWGGQLELEALRLKLLESFIYSCDG